VSRPFLCFACAWSGKNKIIGPAAAITPLLGRRAVFVPSASLGLAPREWPEVCIDQVRVFCNNARPRGAGRLRRGCRPFFVLLAGLILLASVEGRDALL
jgi:hypothetical protein